MESYFFDDDSQSDNKFEISTLFRKLLRLAKSSDNKLGQPSEDNIEPLEKFTEKINSQLLCISASYWLVYLDIWTHSEQPIFPLFIYNK